MTLQHVNVKLFVDGDLWVDPGEFIKVFHRWVAQQSMEELLIDVADYRHVPSGPGVVLVGLEADYAMDHAGNRWGLRYNRKAKLPGSNEDRIRQALSAAAQACGLLEQEFPDLKFSRQELELFINDRALAPNTAETFAACKDEIAACLKAVLSDAPVSVEQNQSDPRRLFRVTVRTEQPFDLTPLAGA